MILLFYISNISTIIKQHTKYELFKMKIFLNNHNFSFDIHINDII